MSQKIESYLLLACVALGAYGPKLADFLLAENMKGPAAWLGVAIAVAAAVKLALNPSISAQLPKEGGK